MEILKSKAVIALIVMVLGVSYIGGVDSNNFEDSSNQTKHPISINA